MQQQQEHLLRFELRQMERDITLPEKWLEGGNRFSAKPSTEGAYFLEDISSHQAENFSKQEKEKEKRSEFVKELQLKVHISKKLNKIRTV